MPMRWTWRGVALGIVVFGQLFVYTLGCGGENCKMVDGAEVCCKSNQAMDSEGRCIPRK